MPCSSIAILSLAKNCYSIFCSTSVVVMLFAVDGAPPPPLYPVEASPQETLSLSSSRSRLTMADHHTITRHLSNLNHEQLVSLGGELGLGYPNMQKMTPLLPEMVGAWLLRQDRVLATSGNPSWASLAKALVNVHQEGLALEIKKGDSELLVRN